MEMDKRRREDRIAVSLLIRVWGMDASHKPFTQTATTLDLTRAGVRVGGLECQLQAGEIIGIQHGAEKARFRVVWAGRKGSSQQGQAGLVCAEAGKYIWGMPLQRLAAAAKPTLGPREPELPTAQAAAAQNSPKADPEKPKERRTDTRYATTGGAEVRDVKDGSRMWGVITDIGTAGCYVEMTTPPKAGTSVRLVLSLQGTDIHCAGEVRNSHLGVGMGVTFSEMSAEDRQRLQTVVERIAAGIVVPLASAAPTATTETVAPTPHPKAIALADHVRSITSALRSIEDVITTAGLDLESRVLKEFRRTLDHSRQDTWSVQRWLEEGADQKQVYKLLDDLESKRMRSAIDLLRDLAMDVDANALTLATEGVDELSSAVEQLRGRLAALKQSDRSAVIDAEEQLQP